jgi:hypothetical protein
MVFLTRIFADCARMVADMSSKIRVNSRLIRDYPRLKNHLTQPQCGMGFKTP